MNSSAPASPNADNTVELSPKAQQVIATIQPEALRGRVEETTRLAVQALASLSRLHLPQDHFEEGQTIRPKTDRHLDLAPYVLGAVADVNRLLTQLGRQYPRGQVAAASSKSDDDFDLEFDLVDGPTGGGVGLASTASAGAKISVEQEVTESVHAIGGMLRSRALSFAERLRFSLRQQDSWPLLIELDDTKRRLTKAVQGLVFAMLSTFAADSRREEILPSYRSSVREAVALRTAVADLSYHAGRINSALATADKDQATPLCVALADRLARFSARPAYRTLRPEDKRAFLEFRAILHNLRRETGGLRIEALRHAVEGFSKFLESLAAINQREVLVIHDRAVLTEAKGELDSLQQRTFNRPEDLQKELGAVVEALSSLAGRSPELDRARRIFQGVDAAEGNSLDLAGWTRLTAEILAGLSA